MGRLAGSDGKVTARGAASGDTCHIDVIDKWGNMVSATPSGGWLQSSPLIPELGFCLGTRAQMFWLEEGLPNSLKPGKRPRTTLSPSMALRDGKPALAFGTPGGDQQDQWSPQMFLKVVHHGMNLQEAIDSPAWHSEHFLLLLSARRQARPSRTRRPFPEGDRRGAEGTRPQGRGRRRLVGRPPHRLRHHRDPEGTVLTAGANPRGMQGYAVGR